MKKLTGLAALTLALCLAALGAFAQQRLKEKLKSHTNTMIEKLSRYMQSSGKTYQDHYATLLHWYEKDEEELRNKLSDKNTVTTPSTCSA